MVRHPAQREIVGNTLGVAGTGITTMLAFRLALSAAAVALLVPTAAVAAPCGTFTADEGDNEIYYGLVARKLTLPCLLSPQELVTVIPEPTYRAAVCWRDVDGDWRYEEIGTCNAGSAPGDELMIYAGAGDDVIMPVTHRGRNDEFICPVPASSGNLIDYPTAVPPQWHSPPLYEWYERERTADPRFMGGCTTSEGCPYLPVSVTAVGGPGSDQIFGAPSSDQLLSANLFGPPWCTAHGATGSSDSGLDACVCAVDSSCCDTGWDAACVGIATSTCGMDCSALSFAAADNELDLMCGQGGDDVILGDEDSGPLAYEIMSGGPGDDFCRGIWPPGAFGGACCNATSFPGCAADAALEATVCAADPYCCSTAWDAVCTAAVPGAGGNCTAPGEQPCCTPSTSPGCSDDPSIESAVCAADPYCCGTQWDSVCVGEVVSVAGATCEAQTDIGLHNLCETLLEAAPATIGAEEAEIFERCGDNNFESLPPIPVGAMYPQDTGAYIISDSPGSLDFCDLPFGP